MGINDEGIPEGWETLTIKDLIEKKSILEIKSGFPCGKTNTHGNGIIQIRPMNINLNGEIDFTSVKFVPADFKDISNYKLKKEDIIFNNTNSPELLGKTALFDIEKECVYSNHMTRIRVDAKKINPKFFARQMYFLFQSGEFRQVARDHVSQSSVSTTQLKSIKIVMPPFSVQEKIMIKLNAFFENYNEIKVENKRKERALELLPNVVLRKALRGELMG